MPQYALAILSGALLAFYGNRLLDPVWSAYLPLLLFFARYCPSRRFICLLGASLLWSNAVIHQQLGHRLPADYDNRSVRLEAVVADLPRVDAGRVSLLLQQVRIRGYTAPAPRRIRLTWYRAEQLPRAGERWQFLARLKQPRSRLNSAGFDYEAWQFVQAIDAVGYVHESGQNQRLAVAAWWSPDRLRTGLAANIDRYCADCRQRGLIKALSLGYRGDIDERARELLQQTGTAHLLAISGLHIGLVATLFYALGFAGWRLLSARLVIDRRRFAAFAALLAALLYAALAGFSLPTVRALIMLAVVLLGQSFHHRINLLQSLSLALALVLIVDPLAVGSPSLWLSFGALMVIGFAQFRLPQSPRGWCRLFLLQCFFTLLFAPLGILLFGQLNSAGLPANLVAIPLVSLLILPLVLVAGLLSLAAPVVAQPLFAASDFLLVQLLRYLEWLSAVGLQSQTLAHWPGLLVAMALLALLLLLLPRVPGARLVALSCLLTLLLWQPQKLAHGEFEARVLDVGMGSSLLLRTGHHSLVYDLGPGRSARHSATAQVLLPVMRRLGLDRADLLIVSHVDQDHSGGLHSLIGKYPPSRLLSGTPRELRKRFGLDHRVRSCHEYPAWRWDGVDFRFLPTIERFESSNNRSCILLINGRHRMLLPGDIESVAETDLVKAWGDDLGAQVLLAPHHGSGTSSSASFIAAVAPQHVIFTLARANRWGFPQAPVVARYRDSGARLYRSDEDGEIRVYSSLEGLQLSRLRKPSRRLWRRW